MSNTKRLRTMSQVYKDFMSMYKDYDGESKISLASKRVAVGESAIGRDF